MNSRKGKRKNKSPAAIPFKIVIEKHADGFVAYPLGLKGVVAGEGNSYEEAMNDVKSAIRFHIETFGKDAISPGKTGSGKCRFGTD